jgi:hypothetical protein
MVEIKLAKNTRVEMINACVTAYIPLFIVVEVAYSSLCAVITRDIHVWRPHVVKLCTKEGHQQ